MKEITTAGTRQAVGIRERLRPFIEDVRKVYGERLLEVILYGSYARGDYRDDSDIDLMLLLDLPETEVNKADDALCSLVYEYDVCEGMMLSPITVGKAYYEHWREVHPLYKTIEREGVILYDARIHGYRNDGRYGDPVHDHSTSSIA